MCQQAALGPAAHALCSLTGGDCLCCSQTCVCPACVRAQAFRLIRLFFDPKGCNALFPSSRGSSCPKDWSHVSCGSWIAGRFLTADPPGTPWVLRSYPCKLHSLSKNGVSAEKFCISRPVCLWTQLWCKGGGPWGQSREQNSPESLFFMELVFPASLGLGDSLFFPKGSALGRLWCTGPAVGTSLTPFQAQSPGLWPRGGEEPLPCRKELGSLFPFLSSAFGMTCPPGFVLQLRGAIAAAEPEAERETSLLTKFGDVFILLAFVFAYWG